MDSAGMKQAKQRFGSGLSKLKMDQSWLKANMSFARLEMGTTRHLSAPGAPVRVLNALSVGTGGKELNERLIPLITICGRYFLQPFYSLHFKIKSKYS